jgi:hypothetical protein
VEKIRASYGLLWTNHVSMRAPAAMECVLEQLGGMSFATGQHELLTDDEHLTRALSLPLLPADGSGEWTYLVQWPVPLGNEVCLLFVLTLAFCISTLPQADAAETHSSL